jgi:hypothetical protein
MIHRKRPDVDIINDILEEGMQAFPESKFIKSLYYQYHERGGLSKKQLEGLYSKVQKLDTIPVNKLATLEAEILKRPTRYKSELPTPTPLYTRDESTSILIKAILEKYPEHKRVLYLKTKYENNEPLSSTETAELKKFHSLLK